ncbi:MAG: DUF2066 domain-containing protein [Alcanivorax sp.]|nr:DUF2066 domain-containing protein [Alcanivorax sp.]
MGLLIWLAAPLRAAPLDTVQIPVTDSSQASLQDALKQGLDTVMIRITGQRALDGLAGVNDARGDIDRWVESYHYDGPDSLNAHYDLDGLTRFLEVHGAPIWAMPRPTLVTWLVRQEGGRAQLITKNHPLFPALADQALERGLPLTVPKWDEQDRSALSLADIRGRFDDRLRDASKRYPHDLIAAAVLYEGTPVRLRWRVLDATRTLEQGSVSGDNDGQAVTAMVDAITDKLAARYAVRANDHDDRSMLVVDEVNGLSAWQQIQRYLQDLTGMRQIQLVSVDGERYGFSLDYAASDSQLRRQLELFPHLQACPSAQATTVQLHYCWQP